MILIISYIELLHISYFNTLNRLMTPNDVNYVNMNIHT